MLTPAGQVMVVGVMRVPASMEIGGEIAKPMIYDSSSERPTISKFRRVVTFRIRCKPILCNLGDIVAPITLADPADTNWQDTMREVVHSECWVYRRSGQPGEAPCSYRRGTQPLAWSPVRPYFSTWVNEIPKVTVT